jgi:hypothetical protein
MCSSCESSTGSSSGRCDSAIGRSWSRISDWKAASSASFVGSRRYVRPFQVKLRHRLADSGAHATNSTNWLPSGWASDGGSRWSSVTDSGRWSV